MSLFGKSYKKVWQLVTPKEKLARKNENKNNIGNTGKRLTKNTIYMYIRMVILMCISLFTSRIILKKLGVEDYGIYNVVGSIVMMFNSLRTIFASSTQRFLSYELGQENNDNLKKVYNLSLQINVLIAIIFLIVAELVGVWFVFYKMNLSPDRFLAANIVLQCSILGAVFSVFTTTYDALIIAHERMNFYAYISIVEAIMKLAICYLIGFAQDRLIGYGVLMTLTSAIVLVCNFSYCRRMFSEVQFKLIYDKKLFGKMCKFAGWNFFGNTSYALSQNGLNMVLNVFGGPVVNTARGIALQVNQVLMQVINNIGVVIQPFTIKTYAAGIVEKTMFVTRISSKIYFIIQLQIVIIFTMFADQIIKLWLGQIPLYSISFLTIMLWYSLIRALHGPINLLFASVGNMKWYQLTEGIVLFLPVPVSYLLLMNGCSYSIAFVTLLVFEFVNYCSILCIAKHVCSLNLVDYLKTVFSPCFLCVIIYGLLYYTNAVYSKEIMINKILIVLFASFLTIVYMITIGFSKEEKKLIYGLIKK